VWAVAAVLMVAGIAAPETVSAQSQVCRQLQTDYARLQARLEAADPVGDAVGRQQAALARAQADHDRMCGVGLFSRPAAICPDLARRIVEMQTNLQRMGRGATTARGPDPSLLAEKVRLTSALAANGCGASGAPVPPAPVAQRGGYGVQGPDGPVTYREGPNGTMIRVGAAPPPPRPQPVQNNGGFFGALFGGFTQQPQRPVQPPPGLGPGPGYYEEGYPDDEYGDGGGRGAYRTLCVRTCDGYYFPISFSTSASRFAVDADVCRARCPAAETRLFVHPTEAESESAVAADDPGVSYTSLPNALKYRTQVVNACTCGRPDPSLLPQNVEDTTRKRSSLADLAAVPLPSAKPRRDLDPDTAWNLATGYIPVVGDLPQAPEPGTSALKPNDRKVRVVGPKFFVAR
jgi:hypothetical protein